MPCDKKFPAKALGVQVGFADNFSSPHSKTHLRSINPTEPEASPATVSVRCKAHCRACKSILGESIRNASGLPRPRLPPVTSAVLPSRRNRSRTVIMVFLALRLPPTGGQPVQWSLIPVATSRLTRGLHHVPA